MPNWVLVGGGIAATGALFCCASLPEAPPAIGPSPAGDPVRSLLADIEQTKRGLYSEAGVDISHSKPQMVQPELGPEPETRPGDKGASGAMALAAAEVAIEVDGEAAKLESQLRSNEKVIHNLKVAELRLLIEGRGAEPVAGGGKALRAELIRQAGSLPPVMPRSSRGLSAPEWQCRTTLLLGEEAMARLAASRVLVVGLGGVGALVLDPCARCLHCPPGLPSADCAGTAASMGAVFGASRRIRSGILGSRRRGPPHHREIGSP